MYFTSIYLQPSPVFSRFLQPKRTVNTLTRNMQSGVLHTHTNTNSFKFVSLHCQDNNVDSS